MGTVFLAKREELARPVAIKFLTLLQPEALTAFERERQALASLNHPNIATIYDVGQEGELPWIAMEYVPGETLTQHCRIGEASLEERLSRFVQVCQAVAAAHERLIVHLDLKPANIMVGNDGVVKLLDFGVARVLSEATAKATLTTPVFSFPYTAPEQMFGSFVTVRADVYSLGVVLHELVAGTLPKPITADEAGSAGMHWPKPSETAEVSQREGGVTPYVGTSQWREIDYICEKATSFDPGMRYGSVSDLAEDVKAFLENRPLATRGRGFRYRLGKFVERHRRQIVATAAVLFAFLGALAYGTFRVVKAEQEEAAALERAVTIQGLLRDFLVGEERVAGPPRELRVADLLDSNARRVDSMKFAPEIMAPLESTLGDAYDKLGQLDKAAPRLEAALRYARQFANQDPPVLARHLISLAALEARRGNLERSAVLTKEARSMLAGIKYAEPELVALCNATMGLVLSEQGEYSDSLQYLKTAADQLESTAHRILLSETLGLLANAQYYLGKLEDSAATNLRAIEVDKQLHGAEHPSVGIALRNLGHIALDRGEYGRAEGYYTRSLNITEKWYGPKNPNTADNLHYLGRAYQYLGRFPEAEGLYKRAYRAHGGQGSPSRLAAIYASHGELHVERRNLVFAEQAFRRATEILSSLGSQHPLVLSVESRAAEVPLGQKKFVVAEELLRAIIADLVKQLPEGHRIVALARWRLARALEGQRRFEEAAPFAEQAHNALKALAGSGGQELKWTRDTFNRVREHLDTPKPKPNL